MIQSVEIGTVGNVTFDWDFGFLVYSDPYMKTFVRPSSLIEDKRIHAGEKPYKYEQHQQRIRKRAK